MKRPKELDDWDRQPPIPATVSDAPDAPGYVTEHMATECEHDLVEYVRKHGGMAYHCRKCERWFLSQ